MPDLIYVARSLRSTLLPWGWAEDATPPPALWVAALAGACAADKGSYELAYLLTPALFRAVQGQVAALDAAWAGGTLPADKAEAGAARWAVIVEWARAAGWLVPGGPVAAMTPAEVAAYRLPGPPCPLWLLERMDAAYAELVAVRDATTGEGEGEEGEEREAGDGRDGETPAPAVPPASAAFSHPSRYMKPKKGPAKGGKSGKGSKGGRTRGLW